MTRRRKTLPVAVLLPMTTSWPEFFRDMAGGLSGVVILLVCAGVVVLVLGEFRKRYGRKRR